MAISRLKIGQVELPENYISGLITSNNGVDAAHDIDISPGIARDDGDTENMILSSSITKQIDAAWAVGSDAGGLDAGTVAADTLYAIWLIKRSDTGVVDALFSTSFTSPTMPTNYDLKRLIGAAFTDSSANIELYDQKENWFIYDRRQADILDTAMTAGSFDTGTLSSIPPKSLALVHYVVNVADALFIRITIKRKGSTVGESAPAMLGVNKDTTGGDLEIIRGQGLVEVDSSQQIEYAYHSSTSLNSLEISTMGYYFHQRQEP